MEKALIFGGQKIKERYSQEEKENNKEREGRTKLETSYVPIFNIVYACKILLYRERASWKEKWERLKLGGMNSQAPWLLISPPSRSVFPIIVCWYQKREKKAMGREKNIKIVFFSTRLTDFLCVLLIWDKIFLLYSYRLGDFQKIFDEKLFRIPFFSKSLIFSSFSSLPNFSSVE